METFAAQSLLYANTYKPLSSTSTSTCNLTSFLPSKPSVISSQSARNSGFSKLRLHCTRVRHVAYGSASSGGTISASVAQGWLLEPVGDGDCKHIGFKVEMPGAYEIFSKEVTVGRVPARADLVIPIVTVSGLHARIQNKEGSLLVTDLDSTNGTYVNEKRVLPGDTEIVPPGSLLTFGDSNLAAFRVSRLQKTKEEAVDSEDKPESNGATAAPQPELQK